MSERPDRMFTCGQCGTVVSERSITLDESGKRVLNCPECHATIYRKPIVARPLPSHLLKMPAGEFDKRPV